MILPIIYSILFLIGFSIIAFIIYWLYKMDSCVCGNKIPEKKYLKEWFIFAFIYNLLVCIYLFTNDFKNKDQLQTLTYLNYLLWILGFIGLIMFIRMFIYIRKLRALKCDCGMLKQQNFIYYYQIVIFSIYAFVVFMLILFAIIFAITYARTIKKIKSKKL